MAVDVRTTDAPDTEYIWVIPHPRVENRVALADQDPRHPLNEYGKHEVFVAHGTGPVRVALNAEVARRLAPADGELLRVDGPMLERAREQHRMRLDAAKAERERLQALAKQEQYDAIGEATTRANDLQVKLRELEDKFERQALAHSAQQEADQSAQQHQAVVDQAKARADEAQTAEKAPDREDDPDVAARREARRQRASARAQGGSSAVTVERPRR